MTADDGGLRIELFVADVARSAAFYERVLGFVREQDGGDYVALRRGDARIGIGALSDLAAHHHLRRPHGDAPNGLGVEIVIEVDDVDAAFGAVSSSGQPVLSPLRERPWGLRDFRIVDPDGYYLRITSR
jgi:predicted enzyme related to lactoylglutathione lyase